MPIHNKTDQSGNYFIWSKHGKKYYYKKTIRSQLVAYTKAARQAQAAYANGYKGD